jgi:hypothetical protein
VRWGPRGAIYSTSPAAPRLAVDSDPFKVLQRVREVIADEIEHRIAILDALDGDPDLEPYLADALSPFHEVDAECDGAERALAWRLWKAADAVSRGRTQP